jgi:hypothetical protein
LQVVVAVVNLMVVAVALEDFVQLLLQQVVVVY